VDLSPDLALATLWRSRNGHLLSPHGMCELRSVEFRSIWLSSIKVFSSQPSSYSLAAALLYSS